MNRTKPILAFLMALLMLISSAPSIALAADPMPNVDHIGILSADFSNDPSVTMNGIRVSARRYSAVVDGIAYEAYCADPGIKGPENPAAVYELSGQAYPQLKNALKNGYPINSEWSQDEDTEERMWWAYVTRVAVAMANHPDRTYAGEGEAVDKAKKLANGTLTANHAAYPPIMVNGVKDAQDKGRTINDAAALSKTFEVTHNRKTGSYTNPFRFEWAAGTPAGAKLVVDGSVIATAPTNPTT